MNQGNDNSKISKETLEQSQLTENEFLDLNLDRNYQWKDSNLIHHLNAVGIVDPFEVEHFKPIEK